jgi:hypothetical protein
MMRLLRIALSLAGIVVFAGLAIGAFQNLWRQSDVPASTAVGLGVFWSLVALAFLVAVVLSLRSPGGDR